MITNGTKKIESFVWEQNTIELKSAVKYMRLILDQKVSFNQHIESLQKNEIDSYPFFLKQDSFLAHLFSFEFTSSLCNQYINMMY